MYIGKLDDIVTKCNNTYCIRIKMKPIDVKSSIYIDSSKQINEKDPTFKIVILLEYQNTKKYFYKRLHSKFV